jgi:uncharacterized protein YecE (DUF72 family)
MTIQDNLFSLEAPVKRPRGVQPAPPLAEDVALAAALSPRIHLGTSTWSYPGWLGQVWAGKHSEATLSKTGLPAYAAHPLLRALWPGPLVARWNLNRLHGPFGYEEAEKKYGEFNEMLDPDPETRAELARIIRGTAGAGEEVFVTISNKAEGSAPLSVRALAQAIVAA